MAPLRAERYTVAPASTGLIYYHCRCYFIAAAAVAAVATVAANAAASAVAAGGGSAACCCCSCNNDDADDSGWRQRRSATTMPTLPPPPLLLLPPPPMLPMLLMIVMTKMHRCGSSTTSAHRPIGLPGSCPRPIGPCHQPMQSAHAMSVCSGEMTASWCGLLDRCPTGGLLSRARHLISQSQSQSQSQS